VSGCNTPINYDIIERERSVLITHLPTLLPISVQQCERWIFSHPDYDHLLKNNIKVFLYHSTCSHFYSDLVKLTNTALSTLNHLLPTLAPSLINRPLVLGIPHRHASHPAWTTSSITAALERSWASLEP